MEENYWPISDIRFNKIQMRWLIDHLQELRNGDWPQKDGTYIKAPKMACKQAKEKGWDGLCVNCPLKPCLNPSSKTPLRVRKERNINRVLEIAAEVDARLELTIDYISGWNRPTRKIPKERR